jgi:sigma-B regulation protein RsbU (phosphoserine phosphatase)
MEQLKDYGFLLRHLMSSTQDAIYFKDRNSRFIMANNACALKHGWPLPEAMVGKTDFDTFLPDHAQRAFDAEQRIINTGEPIASLEEKETWPDGHVTWVSSTKMPLRDAEGSIIGIFGISRDITERKEAELRARHYADEVAEIAAEMAEDVKLAGQMQKNLFPTFYPVFPDGVAAEESCVELLHHCVLTQQVSGDYCSVMKLSETKVGIFLCDVYGVGVRAALGTALIRGVMQEITSCGDDPSAYLSRMNELLHRGGLSIDATACYLVCDVSTGVVHAANAGHPLPIHFREHDGARWLFEDLSLRGPALGIETEAAYPSVECRIEPGDAVVMYSDGIFTIQNGTGDRFGKKRLLGSAHSFTGEPLADIFDGLESDARAFSRDGKFSDDVCLVGLRLRRLLNG